MKYTKNNKGDWKVAEGREAYKEFKAAGENWKELDTETLEKVCVWADEVAWYDQMIDDGGQYRAAKAATYREFAPVMEEVGKRNAA